MIGQWHGTLRLYLTWRQSVDSLDLAISSSIAAIRLSRVPQITALNSLTPTSAEVTMMYSDTPMLLHLYVIDDWTLVGWIDATTDEHVPPYGGGSVDCHR